MKRRLIDANAIHGECNSDNPEFIAGWNALAVEIDQAPTIDAVEIPCDIGTVVYYTKPIVCFHKSHNGVKRGRVVGIEINKEKKKFVWVHFDIQPEGSALAISFEEFGVSAFFSKDEAWNPLERRKPNDKT